jgi:hypothetical protein
MNNRDKNILVNKLGDYFTEEELAVIIRCMDDESLELYQICNADSFDILNNLDEDEIEVYTNVIRAVDRNKEPKYLEDTFAKLVKFKDNIHKEDYIVADSEEAIFKITENIIKEFAKDNGFDDFNIDITKYLNEDYFNDWAKEQLGAEAVKLLKKPSKQFENQLIEVLYNEGELSEFDFESSPDGEPNFKQCLMDAEMLIDSYINSTINPFNFDNVVEAYIEEVGESAFIAQLGEVIEINWEELTEDCIDADGAAQYISIDDRDTVVDINDTEYHVFLEHSNSR